MRPIPPILLATFVGVLAAGAARDSAAAADATLEPPGPLPARPIPVPVTHEATLPNGLATSALPVGALPLVEVRLVVRAGNGDGQTPAVAALTAELMKDGGTRRHGASALLERLEALGAELRVDTSPDATTFAVSTTRSRWGEALALLAEVVREPALDPSEFGKIRARLADEARARALGSGRYVASQALAAALYAPGSRYAHFGLRAAALERTSLAAVSSFWRSHLTPSNAKLFVAGRVSADEVGAVAMQHLGTWKGPKAPEPPATRTTPPQETRVILVDKPGSQSDVYVARFCLPRTDTRWPAVDLAVGILGSGEPSRLFTELREAKSLAYSTSARAYGRSDGPVPLTLYAGTKTESTREAVKELLAQAELLGREGPRPGELEGMRRYLRDGALVLLETVGDVVDEAAAEWRLGLPTGALERERSALATVPVDEVRGVMREVFAGPFLIVVAGDARAIGDDLRSFGPVTVVDAETGQARPKPATEPTP